ncbi:hypothetical protein BC941DRAFT_419597, partial [Chlamydoabsidia padenii]
MTTPHSLRSTSINPANLLELEVLSRIVSEKHTNNDVRGSIPYLAKMAQIIDNQRLEKGSTLQQQQALSTLQADAHRQLGQAYMNTGQYTQAEASLTNSTKKLEYLLKGGGDNNNNKMITNQLLQGYDLLKECFEVLGKPHMVQGMENRKLKYMTKDETLDIDNNL